MSGKRFMIRRKPKDPGYDEIIGKYRMHYGPAQDTYEEAVVDDEE